MELSREQIVRQDFVDNSIYELIQLLNPKNKFIDWDIEMIADIRDDIQYYLINKTSCSELDFYPYIEK